MGQNCSMKQEIKRNRRGVVIWYAVILMTAMCMFASLAVDWGHAQMVKTELRRTADAAARAAAALIPTDLGQATAAAVDIASKNTADGQSVTLVPSQDIEYGFWNVNTHTFTPTSSGINAVHVTARKSNARGTAVPMLFGKALGLNDMNVKGESIVMVIPPLDVDQNISAQANPFLSGMPAGSIASRINPAGDPDYAGTATNPLQSPTAVNIPITDGEILNFDSITGTAAHDPTLAYVDPDGDLSEQIGHNNVSTVFNNNYAPNADMYSENGIGNAWIPINAVVGVFLDDTQPNSSPAPTSLDYRTAASRDQSDYNPQLKQLFFIGDGLDSHGNHQQFHAPKGATRLYLAMMDYYQWSNNVGTRDMKVKRPMRIITVK